MIKIKAEKEQNLMHIICEGQVTHEDYQKILIPALERAIEKEPLLNVFCDLRKLESYQVRAIWDDYKFGTKHIKNFDRLCTVGDQWWLGPLLSISKLFYKMKLKNFKSKQYDEALKWIKQK